MLRAISGADTQAGGLPGRARARPARAAAVHPVRAAGGVVAGCPSAVPGAILLPL